MSTTIRLKKSGATGNVPSNSSLEFGEIALNYADGVLYYKDASNIIQQISGSAANTFETINANGTLVIADSNTDILTLNPGTAINIAGDGITDTITIGVRTNDTFSSNATDSVATANIVNAVYAIATAAFAKANNPITVREVYSSNSNVVNTFANISTIQFDTESGMAVVDEGNNTVTIQLNSTFKYWNINGNAGLEAFGLDTVNFISGNGISISANNSNTPKSIMFSVPELDNAYSAANSAYGQANLAYAQANSNYQPAVTRLDVTTSGASAYLFDQYSGNNPTLYVRAGETIAFSLSTSGHPFMIRVSSGGSNYNTGLTHVATNGVVSTGSSAQGKESGVLYWKVPYELLGNTYVYQCSIHSGMVGSIVIEQPNAYALASNAYSQANAAYGQANSSYGQANLAYGQANTAYDQANSAYAAANNSNTQANLAYNQANSAYTQANSAANTVRVSQNGSSTLSSKQLNFVNTGTVTIAVTDSGDGNANITFTSIGGGGGGGGSALTVRDEGTSLNANVSSIDFVGPLVSATANGTNVTVTISNAGLSNTIIKTTSFTANNAAANLTYSLPFTPVSAAYFFVIKNGIVLTPNTDYSVSNSTLTVIESGAANDAIEIRYFDAINVYESPNTAIVVSSNTVAAQTNTFTVANVTAINRLVVTKNGLQLTPNLHYQLDTSSNTVTLNVAAEIGDVMNFTNFQNVTDITGGSGLTQISYNTSTAAIETVDEWSKSTYRSAKYQMQVESGAGYLATEIMVIHDGVDTNTIQFGTASFGSNVGAFTSDVSGSNVRLRFTATDATSNLTYFRTILANRTSETLPTDLMTGNDAYDLMVTLPFHPTDLN